MAVVPVVASSGDLPLSLRHGRYVRGASCKDAANAEILVWDGVGFSGAHSSQCTSQVTHRGKRFGDGSSNAAASDYGDSFSLNRLSRKAAYRWCSEGAAD
jgi:hypothetical protein